MAITIDVDQTNKRILVGTVAIETEGNGLLLSNDNGLTWDNIFPAQNKQKIGNETSFLSVALLKNYVLCRSLDQDLYYSTDEGKSWVRVNLQMPASDVSVNSEEWLGSGPRNLVVSYNSGSSWKLITSAGAESNSRIAHSQ